MEKDSIDYFINNTVGISVILLRALYFEGEDMVPHTPMDYHIHILYYKNPEMDHVGALCLDTSDILLLENSGDNIISARNTLALDIARLFVDRIKSMMKEDKFDFGLLFNRTDQKLWDFFNEIKTRSYVNNLKGFTEMVKARTIKLIDEDEFKAKPDDTHRDFEIWISEERLIDKDLIADVVRL